MFWQWETLWPHGSDTNGIVPHCRNQLGLEEVVAAAESGSQVLVGVVLALTVVRGVQEGQLLAGVLQPQYPTAQVQAALWEETHGET